MFGSERLTGALLDCLTHHVHNLKMNGDSLSAAFLLPHLPHYCSGKPLQIPSGVDNCQRCSEEPDKSGPAGQPRAEMISACCVAARRVTDALQCQLQSSEE